MIACDYNLIKLDSLEVCALTGTNGSQSESCLLYQKTDVSNM